MFRLQWNLLLIHWWRGNVTVSLSDLRLYFIRWWWRWHTCIGECDVNVVEWSCCSSRFCSSNSCRSPAYRALLQQAESSAERKGNVNFVIIFQCSAVCSPTRKWCIQWLVTRRTRRMWQVHCLVKKWTRHSELITKPRLLYSTYIWHLMFDWFLILAICVACACHKMFG